MLTEDQGTSRRVRLTVGLAGAMFHNYDWNLNVISPNRGPRYFDEPMPCVKRTCIQRRFNEDAARMATASDVHSISEKEATDAFSDNRGINIDRNDNTWSCFTEAHYPIVRFGDEDRFTSDRIQVASRTAVKQPAVDNLLGIMARAYRPHCRSMELMETGSVLCLRDSNA